MSDNNGSRANDAGAGIVGAVVGASVALAASKLLTNKNLRKKILHTATDLKGELKKKIDKKDIDTY